MSDAAFAATFAALKAAFKDALDVLDPFDDDALNTIKNMLVALCRLDDDGNPTATLWDFREFVIEVRRLAYERPAR